VEDLDSERVYADPWVTVRRDHLLGPDGSVAVYSVVETADCSLVIPLDGERVCLVEQYRHPVGGRRWEFPSGSADACDSDATDAAKRELREETGLSAEEWTVLGALDTMPSTLEQTCTVFLATGLSQGPSQRDPEEQDMRSQWFHVSDVERLVSDGAITDAKTVAAFALLLLRLHRSG
jgi:8-oxo-dGTP pyrophosphatase MutT (NUDIX family)